MEIRTSENILTVVISFGWFSHLSLRLVPSEPSFSSVVAILVHRGEFAFRMSMFPKM